VPRSRRALVCHGRRCAGVDSYSQHRLVRRGSRAGFTCSGSPWSATVLKFDTMALVTVELRGQRGRERTDRCARDPAPPLHRADRVRHGPRRETTPGSPQQGTDFRLQLPGVRTRAGVRALRGLEMPVQATVPREAPPGRSERRHQERRGQGLARSRWPPAPDPAVRRGLAAAPRELASVTARSPSSPDGWMMPMS
jgi:hypothetical protein